jgi:putative ABC transport system permease protein
MSLPQDVRHALRSFRSSPSFTAIAAFTLAIGVGASTAVFSVVDALLLRSLPYARADRIATLRSGLSLPDLESIRESTRSFTALGVATPGFALDLTGRGDPLKTRAALLDADLFPALGAGAELGRLLGRADDAFGAERAVVLSHGFYAAQFGADPKVLGSTVTLGGSPFTVVGVLPESFRMPDEIDVYASLRVVYPEAAKARGAHMTRAYFRLKDGVAPAAAQKELDAVARRLSAEFPDEDKGIRFVVTPLRDRLVGDSKTTVLVLFGAVGLVLLVASANFASLLLSRAVSRRREIAVRTALGAGRARIVRQLVTESVLLALLGGALGTLLAPWLLGAILAVRPEAIPGLFDIRLDLRVLAFALATSVATGALFGLIPALRFSRVEGPEALAEGARGSAGRGKTRLHALLVTAEVALAVVLAVGAGLLVKTFRRLAAVDPGFAAESLLTLHVELPQSRYPQVVEQTAFRRRLYDGLAELPVTAGTVSELPLSGAWLFHNAVVEGAPPVGKGEEPEVHAREISGDYLRTMRIPIVSGRAFTPADRDGSLLVAVVNQAFVKQYLAGAEPIGARVRWARIDPPRWMTVVGVAGDVTQLGLDQADQPALYTPADQSLQEWKRWMDVVVRGPANPASLTTSVLERVHRADPLLAVTKVRTMREVVSSSLASRRFGMALLGAFAALGILLSALGLYGVLSHAVAQRTREIGVRMAVGASSRDVFELVVRQGVRLTAVGLAFGLSAAAAATRVLKSLVWGTSTADPATYAALTLLVGLVALAATALPAMRATRVDPIVALREE